MHWPVASLRRLDRPWASRNNGIASIQAHCSDDARRERKTSAKSNLASAINYAMKRWVALTRYYDDGLIEIDNNAAERALRGPVLSRKNFLFAGADSGDERAAMLYTLLETAKLNGINPEAYLHWVLERIATLPGNRLAEMLPWNYVQSVGERMAA